MKTQHTGGPTIRRGKEAGAEWLEKADATAQAYVDAKTAEEATAVEQARKDKAIFDAEDHSDESLKAFIERFEPPVLGIVADLRDAGFIVDEKGPDMFHDGQMKGYSAKYSKKHTDTVTWTTGYSYENYNVWGKEWVVRRFGMRQEDERSEYDSDAFVIIRIYPTANNITHFEGVQYAVWNGQARDDAPNIHRTNFGMSVSELDGEDKGAAAFEKITGELQGLIGGLKTKERRGKLMEENPRRY